MDAGLWSAIRAAAGIINSSIALNDASYVLVAGSPAVRPTTARRMRIASSCDFIVAVNGIQRLTSSRQVDRKNGMAFMFCRDPLSSGPSYTLAGL